jgi:hypothetical protein
MPGKRSLSGGKIKKFTESSLVGVDRKWYNTRWKI